MLSCDVTNGRIVYLWYHASSTHETAAVRNKLKIIVKINHENYYDNYNIPFSLSTLQLRLLHESYSELPRLFY